MAGPALPLLRLRPGGDAGQRDRGRRPCLRGKCEADAELGYQLLKRVTTVMYHHMQSARLRLLDLYE